MINFGSARLPSQHFAVNHVQNYSKEWKRVLTFKRNRIKLCWITIYKYIYNSIYKLARTKSIIGLHSDLL